MTDSLEYLKCLALAEGGALFGVADMTKIETADFLLESQLIRDLPTAISVAAPVSATVLSTIADHPNQLYFHHYRQVNSLLDRIGVRLAQALESAGHRALAIAASQIVDWQNQRAHVSHKRIAAAAGLGWLGRNNLLVTPQHGSRVRLVTVLTDTKLPLSTACRADCGDCRACIAACPAGAIRESAADFDHHACFATLKEFQKQGYVGQYICGICVRACSPEARVRTT